MLVMSRLGRYLLAALLLLLVVLVGSHKSWAACDDACRSVKQTYVFAVKQYYVSDDASCEFCTAKGALCHNGSSPDPGACVKDGDMWIYTYTDCVDTVCTPRGTSYTQAALCVKVKKDKTITKYTCKAAP